MNLYLPQFQQYQTMNSNSPSPSYLNYDIQLIILNNNIVLHKSQTTLISTGGVIIGCNDGS